MPQYIVKPDRDVDFYVYWDTVTDAPWFWGTRAELEQETEERYAMKPERFERADEDGTSSIDGFFGWDDDEFMVHNMGKEPFGVERKNLAAWLASIKGDGGPGTTWDESLTTPMPDWDDDVPATEGGIA